MKKPFVFEVSWEVCNKVGGIHTVLESKAEYIKAQYGEGYFLVGPYLGQSSEIVFEAKEMPDFLKSIVKELENLGIRLFYGTWLIDAEPQVILVDFTGETANINQTKTKLWDWYQVDSLNSDFEFDEPVAWSFAVGKMIEALKKGPLAKEEIVLQCHEWMAGAPILYLKKQDVKISSIFTTHATFMGRVLASKGVDFYKSLNEIDAESKAYEFGIYAKFLLEKAIALNATVLTTVSDITASEAKAFYGRKPEVILENGLNINHFSDTEKATFRHTEFKNIIREFLMYFFFPHYKFNLDKALIYFLVGRYEMHAKGIDTFIDALGELNRRLKNQHSDKTVVAFVAVPSGSYTLKSELIQSKSVYLNIKQSIDSEIDDIYKRLVRACTGEFDITGQNILKQEIRNKVATKTKLFKRTGDPLLITHNIGDESSDQILGRFKEQGLFNREEDRVKVVYFPVYLNGADGLLNLNLYDFMSGSHLGVFPSFYEPWGYTPLEAGALSVPSITTDLSGFGLAVNALGGKKKFPGTYVVERSKFDYKKEVKDLASLMHKFLTFDKDERMISRIHANQTARNFDWKILVRKYFDAHEMALKIKGSKVKK